MSRTPQSVVAIVVRNGATAVSEEELIAHVRTQIASYKKPKFVVFVDTIPRRGYLTDYDVLDELHGGGGYPGGESDRAAQDSIETHR
jgi:long-chain acyl-CoA synthetase